MKMKAYGTEMLEQQLKYAEKKGNTDYVNQLKAELEKRAAAKKTAMSQPVADEPKLEPDLEQMVEHAENETESTEETPNE